MSSWLAILELAFTILKSNEELKAFNRELAFGASSPPFLVRHRAENVILIASGSGLLVVGGSVSLLRHQQKHGRTRTQRSQQAARRRAVEGGNRPTRGITRDPAADRRPDPGQCRGSWIRDVAGDDVPLWRVVGDG